MSDGNQLSFRGWVAMILFMGATVFPAQAMAGFDGFTFGLGWMGLIVLSIVVGAVSGLIFDRWNPVARVLAGTIAGPCVTLAIFAWCSGRQEVWNFEVIFVGVVAMLPGLGVGWVLNKMLGDPTDPMASQYYAGNLSSNPYPQQPYGQYPGQYPEQYPYGQALPQQYPSYPPGANPNAFGQYPQANPAQNPPGFTFGNYPPDPNAPRQY